MHINLLNMVFSADLFDELTEILATVMWNISKVFFFPPLSARLFIFIGFLGIHRKISVLESLVNQAGGLQACKFIKKRLQNM